jgi:hypothetical protein
MTTYRNVISRNGSAGKLSQFVFLVAPSWGNGTDLIVHVAFHKP